MITVCASCLQASCWEGNLLCDKSKTAGTIQGTVQEIRELRKKKKQGVK